MRMRSVAIPVLALSALVAAGCEVAPPPPTEPPPTTPAPTTAPPAPGEPLTIVGLAQSDPNLSILVQAVIKADLAGPLSSAHINWTVFAPTNDAFVAFLAENGIASLDDVPSDTLREILRDHILAFNAPAADLAQLDKDDVRPNTFGALPIDFDRDPAGVNEANIVAADLVASNGRVHVIDNVLDDPDPRPTIAELAIATPDLSILVEAATKADLVGVLSSPGDLTVFAPTNDAFVALLGQLGYASLDEVPVDALRGILLDHVVGQELDAVDVVERLNSSHPTGTLGGLGLNFTSDPLQVNGVNIIATDVEGSNGTVHVIDQVLLRS